VARAVIRNLEYGLKKDHVISCSGRPPHMDAAAFPVSGGARDHHKNDTCSRLKSHGLRFQTRSL
jgi:hypothetical protein